MKVIRRIGSLFRKCVSTAIPGTEVFFDLVYVLTMDCVFLAQPTSIVNDSGLLIIEHKTERKLLEI
eukprot:snap_masked-scaffold_12-processed-gene-12.60-mRNA-1 protein AED:1.00 eAED:1.00 QI:0/-1/0/0/-1/1/1/0/65